jgi:hypothetical protein
LKPNSVVLEYCESCGDKAAWTIHVTDVVAKQDPDSPDMFQVIINKNSNAPIEIDIAYIYILGGTANKEWANLGRMSQCTDSDGDYEHNVLPKNVAHNDAPPPARTSAGKALEDDMNNEMNKLFEEVKRPRDKNGSGAVK